MKEKRLNRKNLIQPFLFMFVTIAVQNLNSKIVNIENIGDVNLTRRKGSSRISVRVKPDGLITVNHPWFATELEVMSFIQKNADWILHQKKLQERRKQLFGINQVIDTKTHSIKIVAIEQGTVRAALKGHEVVITIPVSKDISDEKVQLFIRKVIIEVCRREAKKVLPQRTEELARQFGFKYEKVFLKNLKSKWGSCSSLGNINLNVHLMRLPDHLIDYIILHELTHTQHMNHGPHFWALLNKICNGKARQLDNEMKAMGKLILK
ncbi:MAG: M48 family metallopeptidase [Prolixibacteraceae bacterium]